MATNFEPHKCGFFLLNPRKLVPTKIKPSTVSINFQTVNNIGLSLYYWFRSGLNFRWLTCLTITCRRTTSCCLAHSLIWKSFTLPETTSVPYHQTSLYLTPILSGTNSNISNVIWDLRYRTWKFHGIRNMTMMVDFLTLRLVHYMIKIIALLEIFTEIKICYFEEKVFLPIY